MQGLDPRGWMEAASVHQVGNLLAHQSGTAPRCDSVSPGQVRHPDLNGRLHEVLPLALPLVEHFDTTNKVIQLMLFSVWTLRQGVGW